jgi:tetratricopeptide (TPR) repeat protein
MLARLREGMASRSRVLSAAAIVAIAVTAAWAAWQPQRSANAGSAALAALGANPPQLATARKLASQAHQRDPLSVEPYFDEAAIEIKAGDRAGARRALQAAVRLQPANPDTWTTLADFQLHQLKQPVAAKKTLSAALYLDPRSVDAIGLLLEANRLIPTATS